MAIYELHESGIKRLQKTTFAGQGIRERQDIQRMLREQIEIISEGTMVIAEEFGHWDASRRRIDLLCIDKDANLVVVELKRTEDGGHMELQAIRYSAMISTMTFEQVVDAHKSFLKSIGSDDDAQQRILDFLEWDEPDEDSFAQDVRIVLASAEFSKELTSAVLWLNDKGVDIRCVKMEPFYNGEKILLDIQQVIPLPETEQFQVQVRQKKQKEQQARTSSRDLSKFTLTLAGKRYSGLNKRNLMYQLVSSVLQTDVAPEDMANLISWRKGNLFISFDGELDEEQFAEKLMELDTGGKHPKTKRYFCKQDELFVANDRTYAMTNQWGHRTIEAVDLITTNYPQLDIAIEKEP
jgi:endonuclease NucS-like protein|tara:strand:+ start:46025 stop:47080 length:1056 start_codon:yes stop_codon:yes gene_type:complete